MATIAATSPNYSVFISYAWEDGEHGAFRRKVKQMRDWLRGQSIHVVSDFDHAIRPPENGWPIWMQHSIEDASVVLIVCSAKYKLRYEKRGPKDEGLGATWEGAIITQNLYDGAQRNKKFYPIFVDPVEFKHVPTALKAWCNGHSFPSTQKNILTLIQQCLADVVGLSAAAKGDDSTPSAIPSPQADPPPDPPPDDSERLQHTRERIRHCIGQQHFTDMPNLAFADGLPQAVNDALSAGNSKKQMAEACNDAILDFARTLLRGSIELGTYGSKAERKSYLFKALINAMQQSILLSARQLAWQQNPVLAAYQSSPPCELDVMSWLSVSVLMRDELAEHLQASLPQGQPVSFRDQRQADFANEVELGIFDNESEAGAKALARQIAHRALFPAAADFPITPNPQQISELSGALLRSKKDKNAILTSIDKRVGAPTPQFIEWLNQHLHIGVILINATDGLFELEEGHWKNDLAALYQALQAWQTA